MKNPSVGPYVWMLQASFLFTIMGVLARLLGDWCPWQLIAIARAGLVFLFVAAYVALSGGQWLVRGSRTLWVRSVSGSLSMVCTFYALTHLPVSDVFTLTNMFPIWVALLSWPLLGEVPGPGLWLAVLCGVAGVALIQQPHLETAGPAGLAALAAAAASVFTAVAMLGLHRLRGLEPRAIVVHFSAVATFFCTASYFLFERESPRYNAPFWQIALCLLGVGLTASAGQIFLTRAFAAGDPSRVAVVGLTQVAYALIADVLLFKHRLELLGLVGILLVMAPTTWVILSKREIAEDEAVISGTEGHGPSAQ